METTETVRKIKITTVKQQKAKRRIKKMMRQMKSKGIFLRKRDITLSKVANL